MRYRHVMIFALLIAATLIVYGRTAGFSFVGFDDPQLVFDNPLVANGLSITGLKWAFLSAWQENVFFYPLAMVSHMAAVSVFGLNPAGHHLVNAGLHAGVVVLVYCFLFRLTGALWRSAMVAILVAVHPVNVDSVAWVAQRSTVLCGVFWMTVLWGYVQYVTQKTRKWYWAAFVLFVLAVLAKSSAVTIPFLLLFIDGYAGRLKTGQPRGPVFREKLPFFGAAIVWSLLVIVTAERSGAAASMADIGTGMRIANAVTAYGVYVFRTLWPASLSVYYPFPDHIPFWQPVLSGVFIVCVTALLVRHARRVPMMLLGWLWFLVTLIPMLGFVQAGPWPATADHYIYMPGIGLFICMVWAVPDFQRWRIAARAGAMAIIGIVILALGGVAFHHAGYYRNSIALFKRAVEVTENNFFAHINLGDAYARAGALDKAALQFEAALALRPESPGAHVNRANIDKKSGRLEQARVHYQHALASEPDFAPAHAGLADVLAMTGEVDKAVQHYRRAIAIDKTFPAARYNLGMVLAGQERFVEAYYQVRHALENAPRNPEIHCGLGEIATAMGRYKEAERHFRQALALDESSARASRGLSRIRQLRDQHQ
ncbi:MAG: tetratricopeptide repeat protein [Thermodesulfobacteriota bacterium]|nr:tetratricopeptide repeat protein [Thermodesulfobacteriota bacterium]